MVSVKANDFSAQAVNVANATNAVKMNSDSKNDAFYSFIKQTAKTQDTSSQKTSQKTSNDTKDVKDTTKKENKEQENVTEKQQNVTKKDTENINDTDDAKDVMMQQVDLAMFAAALNIVPTENQEVSQTVTEVAPEVQTVTEVQTNVSADTTMQQSENVVDTTQQTSEKTVEQTSQQTEQTVKTVSQETPKETVKNVEQVQKQQTTETVKTEDTKDVKVENNNTEDTIVVVEEEKTETKSDDTTQMDTKEQDDTDSFENEITTTNRKTFSDDVINIKVGENTQIADSADMAQKVSEKMLAKFAQHDNEFEIQLMPKELGKITIKLVMQNGQAHVSMFAENAKTSSLLAEKAREISSIIEQSTGNETNVEVVDKKEMQSQDQNKQGKGEGFERQQQEQQRQHQQRMQSARSVDFIQQIRLGLWN